MKRLFPLFFTLILLLVVSCHSRKPSAHIIPDEIEEIWMLADSNAHEALQRLEGLEKKYVRADDAIRIRLALLKIRAMDKADISITDDTLMKGIVKYYEEHGTPQQQLEAYYYLAGTYRDCHDSPNALAAYLKATVFGEAHLEEIDTMQLFYAYSQLSAVYELQDNDPDALEAYQRAYHLKDLMGKADAWDYTTLGQSWNHLGRTDSAAYYYKKAMSLFVENGVRPTQTGQIGGILSFFVRTGDDQYSDLCYDMIKAFPMEDLSANCCYAKGKYLIHKGALDSAEVYLRCAYNRLRNSNAKRDCAYLLYEMFDSLCNQAQALEWANEYIKQARINTEELAQEHVTQVNNEYKYHKDQEAEAQLREEALNASRTRWMAVAALLALIIVGIAVSYVYRRRYQFVLTQNMLLKHEVAQERRRKARIALNIGEIRERLQQQGEAMNEEAWDVLVASVDKAFPEYRDTLAMNYPDLKPRDIQVLYLHKAGMKRIEIARLMGVDRAAISRKMQKLESKLGVSLDT